MNGHAADGVPAGVQPELTAEQAAAVSAFKQAAKAMTEEYFECGDVAEVRSRLVELKRPDLHPAFVKLVRPRTTWQISVKPMPANKGDSSVGFLYAGLGVDICLAGAA